MNCKVKFDIPCVIQNALTLPKGWKWTMYCDGSGHISDPAGRTIFSYDLVAQVFEENGGGQQPWSGNEEEDDWFQNMNLEGFVRFAERKIRTKIR